MYSRLDAGKDNLRMSIDVGKKIKKLKNNKNCLLKPKDQNEQASKTENI